MNAPAALPLDAAAALAPYRAAGVLAAVDVHLAVMLARRLGLAPPEWPVALAVALACRAPRHGDTCVDLGAVAGLVVGDPDLDPDGDAAALAWPDPAEWAAQVAASPVARGERPALVLEGTQLFLERYHTDECRVAEQLRALATSPAQPITPDPAVLDALLPPGSAAQRDAVGRLLRGRLGVLIGGPGTGKTTTVAAMLASLRAATPDARVALAAPTGKAAARLGEAVAAAASALSGRDLLSGIEPSTVHRLLGVRSSLRADFVHGTQRHLPHDLVVVDEVSMVSLPLMARLLEAVGPHTRLVLVGDPDQLTSVEAGSVLADLTRPAVAGGAGPLRDCISVLHESHRFPPHSPLGRLTQAIRAGATSEVLDVLGAGSGDDEAGGGQVTWVPRSGAEPDAVDAVVQLVGQAALQTCALALAGAAEEALASVGSVRLLCAHRRGPFGVERWNATVESWLRGAGIRTSGWYVGRPLLMTANDYGTGLYNGDVGVVVRGGGEHADVAFAGSDGLRWLAPSRLEAVETMHAATVHKSQGSEFDHVVVLLPPDSSPLATRELLYTAVTRARRRVTVVGDEAAVRAAVERPTRRASGLAARWWP